MSVYVDFYIGTAESKRDALFELVLKLCNMDWLSGPAAIFSGDFPPNNPLGAGNAIRRDHPQYSPLFRSKTIDQYCEQDRASDTGGSMDSRIPPPRPQGKGLIYWDDYPEYRNECSKRAIDDTKSYIQSMDMNHPQICIVFDGLGNCQGVRDFLYACSSSNGDVVFYSYSEPQVILVNNGRSPEDSEPEKLVLSNYVSIAGGSCPTTIEGSTLETIIKEKLGENLVSGFKIEM